MLLLVEGFVAVGILEEIEEKHGGVLEIRGLVAEGVMAVSMVAVVVVEGEEAKGLVVWEGAIVGGEEWAAGQMEEDRKKGMAQVEEKMEKELREEAGKGSRVKEDLGGKRVGEGGNLVEKCIGEAEGRCLSCSLLSC